MRDNPIDALRKAQAALAKEFREAAERIASNEDLRRLSERAIDATKEFTRPLEELVRDQVKTVMDKSPVAPKCDVEKLQQQVAALEDKVTELTDQVRVLQKAVGNQGAPDTPA